MSTAVEIASVVRGLHGPQFDAWREEALNRNTSPAAKTRPWPHDKFSSVVDDVMTVHVSFVLRDAARFGPFEHPTGLFTVAIRCTRWTSSRGDISVAGSEVEREGWARAAMPDLWCDHAYRVMPYASPTRPSFFHVLLDRSGRPRLAPVDFDWVLSGPGGLVERHKLLPSAQNRSLIAYLRRHGDLLE